MLPVTLQFIVAMIAYAINQRMARRVDYLREEVLVLKVLATATDAGRVLADSSTTTAARPHDVRRQLFGHYAVVHQGQSRLSAETVK